MFDLASDPVSLSLIQTFAAAKKPVSAVCHGPVVFVNATTPSGEPLIKGSTVTGFSNVEEDQVEAFHDDAGGEEDGPQASLAVELDGAPEAEVALRRVGRGRLIGGGGGDGDIDGDDRHATVFCLGGDG